MMFEVVGFVYNGLSFCYDCGRPLPYMDDRGQDKRRIYAWQRHNLDAAVVAAYVDGVVVYRCCSVCNKPANKWRGL